MATLLLVLARGLHYLGEDFEPLGIFASGMLNHVANRRRNSVARYGWVALGIAIVAAFLFRTSLVDAYVGSKAKAPPAHEYLSTSESGDAPLVDEVIDAQESGSSQVPVLAQAGVGIEDGILRPYGGCTPIETQILSESGELATLPVTRDLCDFSFDQANLLAHETSGAIIPASFMFDPYDAVANSFAAAGGAAGQYGDIASSVSSNPNYFVSRGIHGAFAGGRGGSSGGAGGNPGAPSGSDDPAPNTPSDPAAPGDSNPSAPSTPGDVNPPEPTNPPVNDLPSGPSNPPGGVTPPDDTTAPGDGNPPVNENPPGNYEPPVELPTTPVVPPVPGKSVPEPGTLGLLGFTLIGLFLARRRRLV
jgi:hypothetical protein